MKKIILALLIISIVLVLGCTQDTNNENLNDINGMPSFDQNNDNLEIGFSHPAFSGITTKDCFDEICVTRDDKGPVIIEGEAKWICGSCVNGGDEYNSMDKNFQQNCVKSRMLDVVGKPLCLVTKTNKWDLVFNSYDGGFESGEFSYTRVMYNE